MDDPIQPFDERSNQYDRAAEAELQENSSLLSTLGKSIGAILIGGTILGMHRASKGGNLIADMLHFMGHPNSSRVSMTRAANQGASRVASGGLAGAHSIQSAGLNVVAQEIKLDTPDLIKDLVYMQDTLGARTVTEGRGLLQQKMIEHIHEKFEATGAHQTFFGHNLRPILASEVMADQQLWSQRLGAKNYNVLEQAVNKGLIDPTKVILGRGINVDARGLIRDSRIRAKIERFRTMATGSPDKPIFDMFGQARIVDSLRGQDRPFAVLPPLNKGQSNRYFIGGTIYGLRRDAKGLALEELAKNRMLRLSGDPFEIIANIRQGRSRVEDPKGGFFAKLQSTLGIGPAYANRASLVSRYTTRFARSARALNSGEGVIYRRPYVSSGMGEDILGLFPDASAVGSKITKTVGPEVVKLGDLSATEKLRVLGGTHPELVVLKKTAYEEYKASQASAKTMGGSQRILTNADLINPLPTGGVSRTQGTFAKNPGGSSVLTEELTAAGHKLSSVKGRYYDVAAGLGNRTAEFGSYLAYRLNALASSTGLGIGFKPAKTLLGNWGRVIGVAASYKAIAEVGGYLDYAIEDLTGVSPIKSLAYLYTRARVGQQKLRETLGIQSGAKRLETLFPGSIDSELSDLARSAVIPGAAFLKSFNAPGKLGKAAAVGLSLFGLFGGSDISETSQELEAEYAGQKKVPVRDSAFWGMGYQGFYGDRLTRFDYSWYHKLTTDARTKSIYGSRDEYYRNYSNIFGVPLPTPHNLFGTRNLMSLYGLEDKHYYDRPYPETSGIFDEFPVIGPTLSATVGGIIKPVRKMHQSEMYSPALTASLRDTTIPDNSAARLGLEGLPIYAKGYKSQSDILQRLKAQADIASEPLGIYKFALKYFGVTLPPERKIATAGSIGSTSREFYGLGLGGLFGQTEFVRRFMLSSEGLASKERQKLNPIRNTMPTWLPGIGSQYTSDEDYFLDFLHGDPFSKLEQGELRLPGAGYEAVSPLHSGTGGVYDEVDKLLILSDVAPYSQAFKQTKRQVSKMHLDDYWQYRVNEALAQHKQVTTNSIRTYDRLTNKDDLAAINDNLKTSGTYKFLRGGWDFITHDILAETPYFGSKIAPFRDTLERYQKEQIYGDTFADWNRPYESIIRPAVYDIARSNPLMGAFKGAVIGGLMSKGLGMGGEMFNPLTPLHDPHITVPLFAAAGAVTSAARSAIAGQNFIPPHRQREIEASTYMDNLLYLKHRSYEMQAKSMGDENLAKGFSRASRKTIAGADSVNNIRGALSSWDRKYFDKFYNTPESGRERLKAALPPYYAEALGKAWKSDFSSPWENDHKTLEYFNDHALPPEDWLGWHPSIPSDALKIKMIEGGINGVSDNIHRFGFYESQKVEAETRFPDLDGYGIPQVNVPNFRSARIALEMKVNSLLGASDTGLVKNIHESAIRPNTRIQVKRDRRSEVYYYMQDLVR